MVINFEIPSIEDEFRIAVKHFNKLLNYPGVKDLKTAQDAMYLPSEGNLPWFDRYKDFYDQDERITTFKQNFILYRDEIIHTYFHFQDNPHTPNGEVRVEFLEDNIKNLGQGKTLDGLAKVIKSYNEGSIIQLYETGRFFSENVTLDHLKDYSIKLDLNKALNSCENKTGLNLLASAAYIGNKLYNVLDKKYLWQVYDSKLEAIPKAGIATSKTQQNLTEVMSYNNTSGFKPITSEIPKAEIKLVNATCAYLNALNAGKVAFL